MQSAQEYKISSTDIKKTQQAILQRIIYIALKIGRQTENGMDELELMGRILSDLKITRQTEPKSDTNELELLRRILQDLTNYNENYC